MTWVHGDQIQYTPYWSGSKIGKPMQALAIQNHGVEPTFGKLYDFHIDFKIESVMFSEVSINQHSHRCYIGAQVNPWKSLLPRGDFGDPSTRSPCNWGAFQSSWTCICQEHGILMKLKLKFNSLMQLKEIQCGNPKSMADPSKSPAASVEQESVLWVGFA